MKRNISKEILNDNILENLFILRKMNLEKITEEEKEYIEQNNLKSVTHDLVNKEIESLNEVDNNTKELLLNDIERLLDNREIIHMYKCRKYYMAGINDILSIIFNNVN